MMVPTAASTRKIASSFPAAPAASVCRNSAHPEMTPRTTSQPLIGELGSSRECTAMFRSRLPYASCTC
eukprot:2501960-Rhodomonas_salina.1